MIKGEAEVVDFLAGLSTSEIDKLVNAAAQRRAKAAPDAWTTVSNVASPGRDATDTTTLESCVVCGNDGWALSITTDTDLKLRLQEEHADEETAAEAAADLMRFIEVGMWDQAAEAFKRASLNLIGEGGWSCMHWVVHAACTSQNAGDDCGQVGMCECSTPAPATPEGRAFAHAFLRSAKAQRSINSRTGEGATPLMFAADCGDKELCRWLLEAGADASLMDEDGDTASDWAKLKGNQRLADLLSVAARGPLDLSKWVPKSQRTVTKM